MRIRRHCGNPTPSQCVKKLEFKNRPSIVSLRLTRPHCRVPVAHLHRSPTTFDPSSADTCLLLSLHSSSAPAPCERGVYLCMHSPDRQVPSGSCQGWETAPTITPSPVPASTPSTPSHPRLVHSTSLHQGENS